MLGDHPNGDPMLDEAVLNVDPVIFTYGVLVDDIAVVNRSGVPGTLGNGLLACVAVSCVAAVRWADSSSLKNSQKKFIVACKQIYCN